MLRLTARDEVKMTKLINHQRLGAIFDRALVAAESSCSLHARKQGCKDSGNSIGVSEERAGSGLTFVTFGNRQKLFILTLDIASIVSNVNNVKPDPIPRGSSICLHFGSGIEWRPSYEALN